MLEGYGREADEEEPREERQGKASCVLACHGEEATGRLKILYNELVGGGAHL